MGKVKISGYFLIVALRSILTGKDDLDNELLVFFIFFLIKM